MKIEWNYIWGAVLEISKYIPVTFRLTVGALFFAIPVSLLFAFASIKKIPVLYQISKVCLSVLRGTPAILQLFIFYTILPKLLANLFEDLGLGINVYGIDNSWYAYITLAITIITYLTEAFRSSIEGIGKGQYEAAVSVGMTELQAYKRIILPQALVVAIPMLGNTLVKLVKNTSLAFALSVVEVTGATKILAAKNLRYFESYLALMFVYLIVIGILELIILFVESRIRKKQKPLGVH